MTSSYVKFVISLPTAAALVGVYAAVPPVGVLAGNIEGNISIYNQEIFDDYGIAQTRYRVSSEYAQISQQIEVINKFASNLLENIKDLDPDFSNAIDESFWDLV